MKFVKLVAVFLAIALWSTSLYAKTAQVINIEADATLNQFKKEVSGAHGFLGNAKGVLIFPSVIKAGIGVGAEYGEGVLRVGGESIRYYSTASASIGFQLGAQSKSIIIVFLTQKALEDFKNADGWEVGVDGSVALITVGAGKDISSATINQPVVGFVFGSKGLMYNLTLEGSKFSKIKR